MSNVLDFNTAAPQVAADHAARGTVDAEDIKARLNANPQAFVDWLFGGRALCTRGEARIGDVIGTPGASLSIALAGPNAGLWKDHATNEGGDLIGLYMACMGYSGGSNFTLALKEIATEFLGDRIPVARNPFQHTATQRIEEQKQKLGTKPRADMLELGAPVATWKYFDTHGNVVASVVRFEPDGTPASKTYRPYCFKTIEGRTRWVSAAPELRPLYRLPEIVRSNTIVLVEGEKCADALALVGIDATTAMQGAKAPIERTDWSPLHGKTVIVWPDKDEPGEAYSRAVAARLAAIGCTVRIIVPPAEAPEKWDAADCVAEGRDAQALIAEALPYAKAVASKIRLLSLDEIENIEPPSWLIDGVITENGLSVLWGKSGTLKSFAALDMTMCIATPGAVWHGRTVRHGLAVYVAAEGSYGLAKRAIGWRHHRAEGARPNIRLVPHNVVLTSEDADHLIVAINELGEKPILIVVDTLARTFGAGDENKTSDMNAYVSAADKLREATGAHVMIVHHAGKDEERGERGNVALRGACDTMIAVVRKGESLHLINEAPKGKQKDAEEFPTIKLRAAKVAFTHRGEDQTTLVLVPDENASDEAGSEERTPKPSKTGSVEKAILTALKRAKRPMGPVALATMTAKNKGSISNALQSLACKNMIIETNESTPECQLWRLVEDAE